MTFLFQIINSSFPLGSYNYSEGLEFLVEHSSQLDTPEKFQHWLNRELSYGSIRIDVQVMLAVVEAIACDNLAQLQYWNSWLNGTRETKELHQQSIQMGNSFLKLLGDLDPDKKQNLRCCDRPSAKIATMRSPLGWRSPSGTLTPSRQF
ncbi:urease accessory protein UreF [Picosynechococcus sp. NKBG15041c]|uniref:urease accessory protein UreF n=1 Tax=Picosynechococcus sp. NKBG15041c TaxID=1407650 RepID=UPI002101C28D|nr:urease accessory UreF family protein [Picosynechococcus sp. NKBG15041c]